MSTRAKAALAAGAMALALGGGAATYSLWEEALAAERGQVVAGDLDITVVGGTVWTETSADVTTAPHTIVPDEHLATPGDTFTITQDLSTRLEGHNMVGELTVRWSEDAALPADVTADYTLTDARGAALAGPRPLGETTVLTDLPAGDGSVTLQVRLTYAQAKADRLDAAELTALGTIVVELDQIRPEGGTHR